MDHPGYTDPATVPCPSNPFFDCDQLGSDWDDFIGDVTARGKDFFDSLNDIGQDVLDTLKDFTVEQLARLAQFLHDASLSPAADLEGAVWAIAEDALAASIKRCGTSSHGRSAWCVSPTTGPLPPGADAITIGHFIFCSAELNCTNAPLDGLLNHELVHVEQWEEYGDPYHGLYAVASADAEIEARRTGQLYNCVHEFEGPAYMVGPVGLDGGTAC